MEQNWITSGSLLIQTLYRQLKEGGEALEQLDHWLNVPPHAALGLRYQSKRKPLR